MVGALELAKLAIIIRVNIMMKASTTGFNSRKKYVIQGNIMLTNVLLAYKSDNSFPKK